MFQDYTFIEFARNYTAKFNTIGVFPEDLNVKTSFQISNTILLKWTPNSLMDAAGGVIVRKCSPSNGISWHQALSIDMANILYIHCHQVKNIFIYIFEVIIQNITLSESKYRLCVL